MDLEVLEKQKDLLHQSDSENEFNETKDVKMTKDSMSKPSYKDEDASSDDDPEYTNAILMKDTYISSDEYMSNLSEDECATFNCNECGKKFNNNISLKAHLAKKHNPRALASCELCFSKYRGDFQEHLNTEHSLMDGSGYICKKCESICIDYDSALNHQHDKDVFNICKHCGKMYKSQENYNSHLLKHNKGGGGNISNNERTYNCERCGKRVLLAGSLKELRAQLQKKSCISLKCQKCRIKTANFDSGRTHKCTKCNRAFFRSSDLKRHMHSHSGKSSNAKCKEV